MAVRIKFIDGIPQTPTFVLMSKGGRKLGLIKSTNEVGNFSMNAADEVSFQAHKSLDDAENSNWDEITDLRLVWCREWNKVFEMTVEAEDSEGTIKFITAKSLGEAETSQVIVHEMEINTETDIERDDYEPTILYDSEHPESSLMNRLLYKLPNYTIGHVDSNIAHLQRTFQFDGKSVYDCFTEAAEEFGCLFTFDCYLDENEKLVREINAYSLSSYCYDCDTWGEFRDTCSECGSSNVKNGYGEDTNIFVSVENLTDQIHVTPDVESVKNCFRLEAGDDLMTASIININPNGTQYLWNIADWMKADMSDELVAKIDAYNSQFSYYQNDYVFDLSDIVGDYNNLINKYSVYTEDYSVIPTQLTGYAEVTGAIYEVIDFYQFLQSSLMPSPEMQDTSAILEAEKLDAESLEPIAVFDLSTVSSATAQSAVQGMAQVIVDGRYQVKATTVSFNNNEWTGYFTVTNYSDEEDTAVSESVTIEVTDDYEEYVMQKVDKAVNKRTSDSPTDVVTLFKMNLSGFSNELKKYSLDSLLGFRDNCQSIIDILIEQGIANDTTWAAADKNLYETIYEPYLNKLAALDQEIQLRENEVNVISDLSDALDELTSAVQINLNFEDFLGEELLLEFSNYRREDTYSNTNFISDGLTNAEIIGRAREFMEMASKEVETASTLQHSITSTLSNLLVIDEFSPIVNSFENGNWITIKADDKLYRLRLINYEIDWDNLENLTVTFSDATIAPSGLNDVNSILKQATSLATTYDYVARQAKQGSTYASKLDDWIDSGMALTAMKIVNDASEQNITYDDHGILAREYDTILGDYSPKQLKIINKGLYTTDDNWTTAKAGIGEYTFWNPKTGTEQNAYGVIADTIVGNIVLSKEVGIYNRDGNTVIDEHGITITSDQTLNPNARQSLTLQVKGEENGLEYIEKVFYLDSNGNLQLNHGDRIYLDGNKISTADQTVNSVTYEYAKNQRQDTAPLTGWSESLPEMNEGDFLWQRVTTTYLSGDTEVSIPVCLTGANGQPGAKTAIVYLYKRSATAPTVDWNNNLTYTFETRALSSVPSGWSQTIPSGDNPLYVTAASAYGIGNSDIIEPNEWTAPVMMTRNGVNGASISSVTVTYGSSSSASTYPSSWQSSIPAVSDGDYLWTRTVTDYEDSSVPDTVTYTYARQGEDGDNGQPGTSVSITSIQYQEGTSATTAPTGTWSNSVVSVAEGKYLWTKTTFSDGNIAYGVAKQGVSGTNGNDGINVATVFLYKRSATTPSKPSSSLTYTFATGVLTGSLSGWTQTIPETNGNPCWLIQATASASGATDTIAASEWSTQIELVQDGSSGEDGYNQATITLYRRSASAPSKPSSSVTYTFATASLSSVPSGWSTSIPATDGNPCWATTASAVARTATDTIASNEWSEVVKIVEDGSDGTSITINSTSVKYQKGTSGTTKPTGTWQTSVPSVSEGEYLWTQTVVNYNDGSSTESYSVSRMGNNGVSPTATGTVVKYQQSTSGTTVPTGTWNTTPPTATAGQYMWTQTTITYSDNATSVSYSVSKNGTNGTNGNNTATVYLYKRSTTAATVNWTSSLTYTFSTHTLSTTPSGWSQTIPSGDDPLYVTAATAYGSGTTDSIAYTEWSSPIVLSKNGADGNDGNDGSNGLNSATVFLYQRKSSTPSKPSATLTYTFSTGALSGSLNSWSQTIPTGTDPCYVIQATAISTSTTDTIASSEWSEVRKLVEDGVDGNDGLNQATVILYQRAASTPSKPSSTITYTFSNGALSGTLGNWSKTIPSGTDPCWTTQATAISTGATDTIASTEWSTVAKFAENGTSVTITSTSVKYQKGTSGTTKPTGTWQTSVPTLSAGEYLWTQTIVNYSDSSSTESYSVSRMGIDGTNGTNGTDGVSPTVSSTTVKYQQSTSGTTVPSGTWSTTPPTATAGQYMWTQITVTYSDNATSISYSVSKNGVDGEQGVSVVSVTPYYYVGTSKPSKPSDDSPIPSGWSTTHPDFESAVNWGAGISQGGQGGQGVQGDIATLSEIISYIQ